MAWLSGICVASARMVFSVKDKCRASKVFTIGIISRWSWLSADTTRFPDAELELQAQPCGHKRLCCFEWADLGKVRSGYHKNQQNSMFTGNGDN